MNQKEVGERALSASNKCSCAPDFFSLGNERIEEYNLISRLNGSMNQIRRARLQAKCGALN